MKTSAVAPGHAPATQALGTAATTSGTDTMPAQRSGDAAAAPTSDAALGARTIGARAKHHPKAGHGPARREDKRPNIVLFVADDQTFDSIKKMPYMSRARGTRLKNAVIENPLCCPSRATILSGKYSPRTGVGHLNGHDFQDKSTIATWLKKAGYKTSLIGKYLNEYPFNKPKYIPPGWTDWHSFHDQPNGGATYYDYDLNENGKINHFGRKPKDYSTDVIAGRARQFIHKEAGGKKPLFMYVTPYGPHADRIPAPRHQGMFRGTPVNLGPGFYEKDRSDKSQQYNPGNADSEKVSKEHTRQAYRTIQSLDDAVIGIRKQLKKEGELKNTIFIYMSDQGYSMGQHGWKGKMSPYEESVQTPMIVTGPGIPKGRTINDLMSNADVAPTIAGFANAKVPKDLDGRNLEGVFKGKQHVDPNRAVLLHQPGGTANDPYGQPNRALEFWGLRTQRYKYIETFEHDGTKVTELYDLKQDPHELESVAGSPQYADIQADLTRRLAAEKAKQQSQERPATPRPPGSVNQK